MIESYKSYREFDKILKQFVRSEMYMGIGYILHHGVLSCETFVPKIQFSPSSLSYFQCQPLTTIFIP